MSEVSPLILATSHFDDDMHIHLFVAPNEQPAARIKFDRIGDTRDNGIACEVTVWVLFGEDEEVEPVLEFRRIPNLLVSAGWEKIAQQIADKTEMKFDWTVAVENAVRATIRQYRTASSSHIMLETADPEKEDTPFLIKPLISSSGLSLWYSPPGAGKSMTALAAAVSVATGYPVFGNAPSKIGTVIYVDFEDESITHAIRLNAILKSMEWEGDTPSIVHFTVTGKFADAIGPIKTLIREHEAVLVIIDSIGQARGSDPSDGDSTIKLMKGMRSFKVPVLGVDHVTKVDYRAIAGGKVDPNTVMAIGSQFSTASARLAWFFQKMTTSTQMHTKFNLHNTKHNHVAQQDIVSMDVEMENNDRGLLTSVKFTTWERQMFYDITQPTKLEAAVVVHYRANRPLGSTELARMSGADRSTLATQMNAKPFWTRMARGIYELSDEGIVYAKGLVVDEGA